MPTAAPNATRAIAYIRVSTDKQAASGLSLEAQRAKVEAYAALYDLELVAVEVDAGASGKTLARPGLERALARIEAGEADALLVAKLDRLTRSVADLAVLLDRYFARNDGPALLVVAEQVDTRSPAGRLVLNVLMAVAQWEREAIGERTRAALAAKRARGEYCGGEPPYGWRMAAGGVGLEPHPAEQRALRAARELRAAGWSLRRIGAELERRGTLTRRGSRRWHPQQVKCLLAAPLAEAEEVAA